MPDFDDRLVPQGFRSLFSFPNKYGIFMFRHCQHSFLWNPFGYANCWESSDRAASSCVPCRMEWIQALVNSFGLKYIRFHILLSVRMPIWAKKLHRKSKINEMQKICWKTDELLYLLPNEIKTESGKQNPAKLVIFSNSATYIFRRVPFSHLASHKMNKIWQTDGYKMGYFSEIK